MSEVETAIFYGKDDISVLDLKIVNDNKVFIKERKVLICIPWFSKWKEASYISTDLIHNRKDFFRDGEKLGRTCRLIEFDWANKIPFIFKGNTRLMREKEMLQNNYNRATAMINDLKKICINLGGEELLHKYMLDMSEKYRKMKSKFSPMDTFYNPNDVFRQIPNKEGIPE